MKGRVVICSIVLCVLCGHSVSAEEGRSVDDMKSRSCKVVLRRSDALTHVELAIRGGVLKPWTEAADTGLRSQVERYIRIHADEDVTAMLELLRESQAAGIDFDLKEEERLRKLEVSRRDILCARPIAYVNIEKTLVDVFIRVCVKLQDTCKEDLITTEWKRLDGQWVLDPGRGEILGVATAGELKPISQAEIDKLEAAEDDLAEYHMRLLATILWRYRLDTGGFPSPSGTLVPVSELTDELVPRLAPRLFEKDPWCGKYFYWTDGGGNFLIVSPGRDGQLGRGLEHVLDAPSERLAEYCSATGLDEPEDLLLLNQHFCPIGWYEN